MTQQIGRRKERSPWRVTPPNRERWRRTQRGFDWERMFHVGMLLQAAAFLAVLILVGGSALAIQRHLASQWDDVGSSAAGLVRPGSADGARLLTPERIQAQLLELYLNLQQAALLTPAGESSEPVLFRVEPGQTADVIAQRLEAAGLVHSGDLFRLYIRVQGLDQRLEAGEFELAPSMTIPEVVRALQRAQVGEVTVTIPEGWRMEQVADYLHEQGIVDPDLFLAAARSTDVQRLGLPEYAFLSGLPENATLEGYLFPDTYRLPARARAEDVLRVMLNTFDVRVSNDLRQQAVARGMPLHDVIILASIVEREAVHADERPLIAGVYLNRLQEACNLETGGPFLQADPTVQYARGEPGNWWWRPESIAEYEQVQSAYNTYRYPGLPPGPIASPGLSAIQAVLSPAETDYCFFLATGEDGRHVFAATLAEHQQNLDQYGYR